MDEVARTGDEIVITKRGKPVARLKAESPPEIPDLTGSILYQDDDIWKPLGLQWIPRADKGDAGRP
jgi:antitoxin (DNA-binding transcriptional repressor) of toxin-antitoxin stability system